MDGEARVPIRFAVFAAIGFSSASVAFGCQILAGLDDPIPDGGSIDSGRSDVSASTDTRPESPRDAPPSEGSADSGQDRDGSSDAPGEADAGACVPPTIERVQVQSLSSAGTATTLPVVLDVTAGHLLVAAVGAQGTGTLSVVDSMGDTWTGLPVQSDTFLSLAGCDYEDWAQIFYTTSIAGGADTVTMSTAGAGTYLALAVAEYTSSGTPLLYDTNVGQIASLDASTNVQGPGSLTTNGCTDLLFVFFTDELPSNTTWAPKAGLIKIANNTGWAWMLADDLSTPPGAHDPTAICTSTDSCWASVAVSFKTH